MVNKLNAITVNRKQWETGREKLKPTKSKVPLNSVSPGDKLQRYHQLYFAGRTLNSHVPSSPCYIPKTWTVGSKTCVKIPFRTLPFVASDELLNIFEALSFVLWLSHL